jgi:hypothetical protein
LAIHSRFPATLHYYRRAKRPSLFDRKEIGNRPQDLYDDGVEVAGDGLVYPKVERDGESLWLIFKRMPVVSVLKRSAARRY